MVSASLVGSAATLITIFQVGRQVYDVKTADDPVGVSIPTWLLALVQSAGIGALSIDQQYAPAIAANGLVAVGCCAIVGIVGRTRSHSWAVLGALVGVVVVLVAGLAVLISPRVAGTVGDVAALVLWLPQAARVLRGHRAAGLSVAFFLAGFVSSGLWLTYAGMVGQWRLAVPPLCAAVTLLITAVFARRATVGGVPA